MIDFSTLKELYIDGIKLVELSINNILVWKSGYKNWVKFSTESDGKTVYNGGLGYMEGYRLSSSGALKAQAGAVATGFIPATKTDVIRMAGVTWGTTVSGGYSYIQFYDDSFAPVGHINKYQNQGTLNGMDNASGICKKDSTRSGIITDENGVTLFDVPFASGSNFSYFRISATGNGADMIVTINEEIE